MLGLGTVCAIGALGMVGQAPGARGQHLFPRASGAGFGFADVITTTSSSKRLTCDYGLSSKPVGEFLEEAKSFHYDLALLGNKHTLGLLFRFGRRERVLFKINFLYVPVKTTETNTKDLEGYAMEMRWMYGIAWGNV